MVDLGEGKRFVKQLVKFDNWLHPQGGGKRMKLDRAWAEKVADNFNKKVSGQVAVPLGHPKSSAELAQLNRGELTNVEIRDDGMYGVLDVRDAETAKKIEDNLLWDVSISWDPNYVDKLSGEEVGPALLHVGLLTDPYLKGMKPFEALANSANAIMLSESKENEVAVIKNDRKFPVQIEVQVENELKKVELAVGEEITVAEAEAEKVAAQIKAAEAPAEKKLTAEEKAAEEEVKAIADKAEADAKVAAEAAKTELEKAQKELADARAEIALRDAKSRYTELLSEGKIVPAQEDAFMSLSTAITSGAISLADGATTSLSDLVTNLFKGAPKRINFGEDGAGADENAKKTPWDELSDEERDASAKLGVTADEFNKVNGTSSQSDNSNDNEDQE